MKYYNLILYMFYENSLNIYIYIFHIKLNLLKLFFSFMILNGIEMIIISIVLNKVYE